VEFYGFHAFIYDSISSALRRMDREYVGLHVRGRRVVHTILPRYGSHRQLSRKYRVSQRSHPRHDNNNNVFGTLPPQVLNLFLALLLSNFGSSSLSAPTADSETNKIAEAFNRISRFKKWIKSSIFNALKGIKNKMTRQISVQPSGNRLTWLCLCVVYS
jgi:hypothetical protein